MKTIMVCPLVLLAGFIIGGVVFADQPPQVGPPIACPTCGLQDGACPACGGVSPAYLINYGHCGRRCQAALAYSWNCGYYYTQWGSPVALVVPPTAERQYSMGWGVGNTRLTRIYHQFGRPYPGNYFGPGRRFLATPYWPSDTAQFGVYYVRGPW